MSLISWNRDLRLSCPNCGPVQSFAILDAAIKKNFCERIWCLNCGIDIPTKLARCGSTSFVDKALKIQIVELVVGILHRNCALTQENLKFIETACEHIGVKYEILLGYGPYQPFDAVAFERKMKVRSLLQSSRIDELILQLAYLATSNHRRLTKDNYHFIMIVARGLRMEPGRREYIIDEARSPDIVLNELKDCLSQKFA